MLFLLVSKLNLLNLCSFLIVNKKQLAKILKPRKIQATQLSI